MKRSKPLFFWKAETVTYFIKKERDFFFSFSQLVIMVWRGHCVVAPVGQALPTMPCFQWNILYRRSCGAIVMKHTLININSSQSCILGMFHHYRPPHDHLYKMSHWKQGMMGSASYLVSSLTCTCRYMSQYNSVFRSYISLFWGHAGSWKRCCVFPLFVLRPDLKFSARTTF